MSIILNIDTAVQTASVCLSQEKKILGLKINPSQKDHAAWLQPAIQELMQESQLNFQQLSAIAVSAGPGSYTGLRVGMATAKGLCYALNLPLIAINTLQIIAAAVNDNSTDFICPMIDARRMEVFTALFDHSLKEIVPSSNQIVDENFFHDWLKKYRILFCGNGSFKFKNISNHPNSFFKDVNATAENMISLSLEKLDSKEFADLAYSEPFYGKEFHSTFSKPSI